MTIVEPAFYQPALRMKTGELAGLRRLAADIAPHVLPRIIVPPPKERDADLIDALNQFEDVPNTGSVLAQYLFDARVILDVEFLYKDFGEEASKRWLPRMFEIARNQSVFAIPSAPLVDLMSSRIEGLRASIDGNTALKFAIQLSSGDLIDPATLREQLNRSLSNLGLSPQDCIVTANFKGSEFGNPEIAAGVIEGAIDMLQEFGQWQKIAVQGTSYPLTNPASAASQELVQRKEWIAWTKAVDFFNSAPDHLMFGDYAPDHAKMEWNKKGGAPAHRCYRYTTEDSWFIVRGPDSGPTLHAMKNVCDQIVSSQHFAGRSFSSADEYIYKTAKGAAGPGSSTNWREMNICHHITRVVRDMGQAKGIKFTDKRAQKIAEQMSLL